MKMYLNEQPVSVAGPANVVSYLMANVYDKDEMYRESCYAVMMDKSNRIVGHYLVSVGGLDKTVIDVRLICKAALDAFATGVILTHNHPSGNPLPSQGDIANTARVKKALNCLGLQLVDHIVVAKNSFYSFSDERVTKGE